MKKLRLLAFAFVAFLFAGIISVSAATSVKTEEQLNAAILNGGSIVLENDITITKPIELFKDTEISSLNGYTLDGTGMSLNGKNGSILAAHAKLTLDNVNLKGAAKYGMDLYCS